MRISDQLIELVISGGGTEEERMKVVEYFKENPERLAQYFTEESWENFVVDIRVSAPRERMLGVIRERVGLEARVDSRDRVGLAEAGLSGDQDPVSGGTGMVRTMKGGVVKRFWWAAAAILLVVGMIGSFYRKSNKDIDNTIPAAQVVRESSKKAALEIIANSSLKPRTYSLPDGSTVRLAGNSSISFASSFAGDRREIYLKGEAIFTVAADKARPFSVHSRKITTTALGTVFRVNDKDSILTMVHLYSGRVVIKGNDIKDVYLLPGERLLLNNADLLVQIKRDEPRTSIAATKPQPVVLQFTKQSLAGIFEQLHQRCGVVITYEGEGLKNIDFTGVYNSDKETVESFLSTICDLNELGLKETSPGRFSIQAK